jgi:UDP-glucose 4-epimerase
MKCLVTGGAGFIGSNVADAFLGAGHEVWILDDLSSGKRENVPAAARFVQGDVRSPEAAALIRAERFDAISHHAAQIDVRKSVADPRHDADVNLLGMLNLLEAAAAAGVKRFLFASSGGACYGEPDIHPAPETHPTRPCSPYGVAKAAGELYLNYYGLERKLSWCALRYANVYGPRQDPHGEAGVVAIFTGRCLEGRACTIFGDGKQTRDYVFVGDVARANLLALTSDFVGPVNIGTGRETDVVELQAGIARAAGRTVEVVFAPAKPGEQRRSSIDPAKAATVLGWRPEVTLERGLSLTADFFRARRAA